MPVRPSRGWFPHETANVDAFPVLEYFNITNSHALQISTHSMILKYWHHSRQNRSSWTSPSYPQASLSHLMIMSKLNPLKIWIYTQKTSCRPPNTCDDRLDNIDLHHWQDRLRLPVRTSPPPKYSYTGWNCERRSTGNVPTVFITSVGIWLALYRRARQRVKYKPVISSKEYYYFKRQIILRAHELQLPLIGDCGANHREGTCSEIVVARTGTGVYGITLRVILSR